MMKVVTRMVGMLQTASLARRLLYLTHAACGGRSISRVPLAKLARRLDGDVARAHEAGSTVNKSCR
jgi:hypothetical protein